MYSDEYYCCYGLKCTTLPLLSISCQNEVSWEIPINIMAFDNQKDAAHRVIYSDGMMHVRGASTRNFPKQGYRLTLLTDSMGGNARANHISLFGMRQDDDWILYAAYNDQEKIRNVFSSNLWEASCVVDNAYKVNTGMEYKFVELFIDGHYWGLYALGYPIDEKQLEMDGDTSRNALYKKSSLTDERTISYPGGYELKTSEPDNAAEQTIDDSAWELLYRYYYELAGNAQDTDRLLLGIDLDNAIDFMLFCNLVQGVDNVSDFSSKNLCLALWKEGKAIRGLYCLWDLDLTWGNTWTDLPTFQNATIPYLLDADYNRIMRSEYLNQILVNNDSNILDKLLKKYWKLRSDTWSEQTLLSMLDLYESQIYGFGAYLREMERWPGGTYADPDDGLHTFKEYVSQRLEALDRYYERLEQLRGQSLYIKRSAQYEDFLDYKFLIELNDKQLLKDRNYTDLLEYMGINIKKITKDVRYILASPSTGAYDYLPSIGAMGDIVKTSMGEVASYRDTDTIYTDESYYTVHLNGLSCYVTNGMETPAIRFFFADGNNTISLLDFSTDFTCSPQIKTFRDLKLYLKTLALVDGVAVIHIGSADFWQDTSYSALFADLGIENITAETRIIIYNFMQQSGSVIAGAEKYMATLENSVNLERLTHFEDESSKTFNNYVSCVVISEDYETSLDKVVWRFAVDDSLEKPQIKILECLRPANYTR